MSEALVPTCTPQAGASASVMCPEGYALTHVASVPFGAGELDAVAGAEMMGAYATFFGLGLLFALIKRSN